MRTAEPVGAMSGPLWYLPEGMEHSNQVSCCRVAPGDVFFDVFFQCKVGFAGDYTEVVWPVSLLEMPLKSPDHVMRSMLDQQAQLLLKQVKKASRKHSSWP